MSMSSELKLSRTQFSSFLKDPESMRIFERLFVIANRYEDDALVGVVSLFSTLTPPTNWLKCDGQAVSRTMYSSLFSLIAITYGAGDGTTTFNVPNLPVVPLATMCYMIRSV